MLLESSDERFIAFEDPVEAPAEAPPGPSRAVATATGAHPHAPAPRRPVSERILGVRSSGRMRALKLRHKPPGTVASSSGRLARTPPRGPEAAAEAAARDEAGHPTPRRALRALEAALARSAPRKSTDPTLDTGEFAEYRDFQGAGAAPAADPAAPVEAARVEELVLENRDLRRMQEVIHYLAGAPDLARLCDEVTDLALGLSGAERAIFALRRAEPPPPEAAAPAGDAAAGSSDALSLEPTPPSFPPATSGSSSARMEPAAGAKPHGRLSARALRNFSREQIYGPEFRLAKMVMQGAAHGTNVLHVNDLHADARFADRPWVREIETRALLVCPLVHEGATLGVLYLDHPSRPGIFAASEARFFAELGRHVGCAIARLRALEEARAESDRLRRVKRALSARVQALGREVGEMRESGSGLAQCLGLSFEHAQRKFTRRYLAHALRRNDGDLDRAASEIGIDCARMADMVREHGLGAKPEREALRPAAIAPDGQRRAVVAPAARRSATGRPLGRSTPRPDAPLPRPRRLRPS